MAREGNRGRSLTIRVFPSIANRTAVVNANHDLNFLLECVAMNVRPIRTKANYRWALREVERLWDANPGTPNGDRVDVLVTLIEAYEKKHFPIPAPDPIAAIEFMLEQKGLTRRDLEPAIGSRGRVSEILTRKRPLTLPMVRALSKLLDIPTEILAQDYRTRSAA